MRGIPPRTAIAKWPRSRRSGEAEGPANGEGMAQSCRDGDAASRRSCARQAGGWWRNRGGAGRPCRRASGRAHRGASLPGASFGHAPRSCSMPGWNRMAGMGDSSTDQAASIPVDLHPHPDCGGRAAGAVLPGGTDQQAVRRCGHRRPRVHPGRQHRPMMVPRR
jgi:hypothetical protein